MEKQEQIGTMDTDKSNTPDIVTITFDYNTDFTYESVIGFAQQFPTYQTKGSAREQKHGIVFQLVSHEIATVAVKMWQLVEDWDGSKLKINKEIVPKSVLLECRDNLLPGSSPSQQVTTEVTVAPNEAESEPDWAVDSPGVVVAQVVTNQVTETSAPEIEAQNDESLSTPQETIQAVSVSQPVIAQQAVAQPPLQTTDNSVAQNNFSSQNSSLAGTNGISQVAQTANITDVVPSLDPLLQKPQAQHQNTLIPDAVVPEVLLEEVSIQEASLPDVSLAPTNIVEVQLTEVTNLDSQVPSAAEQIVAEQMVTKQSTADHIMARPESIPPLTAQVPVQDHSLEPMQAQAIEQLEPIESVGQVEPMESILQPMQAVEQIEPMQVLESEEHLPEIDLTGPSAFTPLKQSNVIANAKPSTALIPESQLEVDSLVTPPVTTQISDQIKPLDQDVIANEQFINQELLLENEQVIITQDDNSLPDINLPKTNILDTNVPNIATQETINMNIAGNPQIPTQVTEATVGDASTQIVHENLPDNLTPNPEQVVNVVVGHPEQIQLEQPDDLPLPETASLETVSQRLESPSMETPETINEMVLQPLEQEVMLQQSTAQTVGVGQLETLEEQSAHQPEQGATFDGIDPDAFAKPIVARAQATGAQIAQTAQGIQQQAVTAAQPQQIMQQITQQGQQIGQQMQASAPDLAAHAQNAGQNLDAMFDQSMLDTQANEQANNVVIGRYATQSDVTQNDVTNSTEDFSYSEISVGRFPNSPKEPAQNAFIDEDAEALKATHREIDIGIGELPTTVQSAATTQAEVEYITHDTSIEGFDDGSEDLGLKTVIDESAAKPIWRKLLGGKS